MLSDVGLGGAAACAVGGSGVVECENWPQTSGAVGSRVKPGHDMYEMASNGSKGMRLAGNSLPRFRQMVAQVGTE